MIPGLPREELNLNKSEKLQKLKRKHLKLQKLKNPRKYKPLLLLLSRPL
jgi:hypothetical protein